MKELLRFVQTRPAQTLKQEQLNNLALPLYSGNNLSAFAKEFEHVKADATALNKLLAQLKKNNQYVSHTSQLPQVLCEVYNWLDYKANPSFAEFKTFVEAKLSAYKANYQYAEIEKAWQKIADTLLITVYFSDFASLPYNGFLLIKACYVIHYFLDDSGKSFSVKSNTHAFKQCVQMKIIVPKLFGTNTRKEQTIEGNIPLSDIKTVKNKATGNNPWTNKYTPLGDDKQNKECECTCDDDVCEHSSTYQMKIEPYIGDLLLIKEDLVRYEEGDVAYIENILAGEKKERKHRTFLKTEDFSEQETNSLVSDERDLQVSEKDSLQSEIAKTVQMDAGVNAGITYTTEGPVISTSFNAQANASIAKTTAESAARAYSRDVVSRSVRKIEDKVRKLNSKKVTRETEEKNNHEVDNINGEHKAGLYFWVNKVTRAQVMNYGKRLMFDIVVPEPAALYKKLIALKRTQELENQIVVPKKPQFNRNSITRLTYRDVIAEYEIAGVPPPPDEYVSIAMSFQQNINEDGNVKTDSFSQEYKSDPIPDQYRAVELSYQVLCSTGHPKNSPGPDEISVLITAANQILFNQKYNQKGEDADRSDKKEYDWNKSASLDVTDIQGNLIVSVAGFTTCALALSASITIKCKLKDEAYKTWQHKVFDAIMDSYLRKQKAFEEQETAIKDIKARNPFINRETEKNELKRHAIAILLGNYFNGTGSLMNKVEPCGYPEIDAEKLEKESAMIQFFEQVLDWNYLTYLFYHSMWAKKCKWPALMDIDSGDALFDKFLMAGAARLQIPIRYGMEEMFTWFLESGRPWDSTTVPPFFEDNHYMSLIQEIIEASQGNYENRDGAIEATKGSTTLTLRNTAYYWDELSGTTHALNIENDTDREILVGLKTYRIKAITQAAPTDTTTWQLTIDEPYAGEEGADLAFAIGAKYIGAPWEIVVPTELVYLQNNETKLPAYPLH